MNTISQSITGRWIVSTTDALGTVVGLSSFAKQSAATAYARTLEPMPELDFGTSAMCPAVESSQMRLIKCPSCQGRGGPCRRCLGTGETWARVAI